MKDSQYLLTVVAISNLAKLLAMHLSPISFAKVSIDKQYDY